MGREGLLTAGLPADIAVQNRMPLVGRDETLHVSEPS